MARSENPKRRDTAASHTMLHANTPTVAYFDTLGRTFLTIADNGGGVNIATRVELDIEGNQRSVTDALDRNVMTLRLRHAEQPIHQASMEAGERWMLNDVTGKPIRAWDSRGHNFRTEYDALRRPRACMCWDGSVNSDPRTTAAEVLFQKTDLRRRPARSPQPAHPRVPARGLRRRGDEHGHNPATIRMKAYDFKGNLLRSSRGFFADYKALPNWRRLPPLRMFSRAARNMTRSTGPSP